MSTYWNKENRWSEEEETILKDGLKEGKTFSDIVEDLPKRTEKAVKMRAMKIAREEIKSGEKSETVLDKYGLDKKDYKAYLDEMSNKESAEKKESVGSLAKKIAKLEEEVAILKSKIK